MSEQKNRLAYVFLGVKCDAGTVKNDMEGMEGSANHLMRLCFI